MPLSLSFSRLQAVPSPLALAKTTATLFHPALPVVALIILGLSCLALPCLAQPLPLPIEPSPQESSPQEVSSEEDSADEPQGFQAEFKRIFGSDRSTNLSAAQYLEQLVAGVTNDQKFREQITKLGSDIYAERQDAEAFLFSVPILPEKYRVYATESNDMEVRYRLNSIFTNRKSKVESLVIAALKTIESNGQPEPLANVLKLLTTTESTGVEKAAIKATKAITHQQHEKLLLSYRDAKSPEIRLLIAQLLVNAKIDDPIAQLIYFLSDDEEFVQLEAAKMLIDLNHKPAFEKLVDLLTSDSVSIAARSARVLKAITEQDFGNISYSDTKKNQQIAADWAKWQDAHLASTKLRLPIGDFLGLGSRLNGHTLVAKDGTTVIEYDADRNEILRFTVPGVLCAEKTVEGNYLLFSYSSQWLREYSPEKKIIWQITGIKFNNAMPLANGNVLVTVGPNSVTREIDPKTKKTVWEYKTSWWPNDAYRLSNGNTLIGGKGGVVEVTPEKKVVWEFKNDQSSTIVVAKPTENDGVLIGWTSGLAKELSRDKKTIWEHKVAKLSDVFRDPNGNTLFATNTEIIELDPDKKTVWKIAKQSKTASVRR